MKNLPKIGLIIFIVLIPVGIWMQMKANIRAKKDFDIFYSAEINSLIKDVKIANHGTYIKLLDGRDFIFYPYTDKLLNNSGVFNNIAKEGDRIMKKSFSDTLFLYQEDERLIYTFRKW